MKKIGIMADSHSGILKQEAEELDIHVLPMPFYLNGELFHEDLDFSRTGFYEKLREGADVSTSQPSPQEVMEMWDEMLLSYDQILYIPLSSSLSGSCMTAAALSQEPKYENKVYRACFHTPSPFHSGCDRPGGRWIYSTADQGYSGSFP